MTESEALFQRMKTAAIELCQQNEFGDLHIFVADGNCENEDLEFCLGQPGLTPMERDFAQRMLNGFSEEQRHGVWAFAQCADIRDAAEARPCKGSE